MAPNETTAQRWKWPLTIGLIVIAPMVYAVCPPQFQEEWVQPMFQAATTTLKGAVSSVDSTLSAQLETESQRLTSAIAVLTKQKALVANQVATSSHNSAQQTATAMNVLSQTERVKAARFDYGGEFGQGYSPCAVYATRQVMANRDAEMHEELGTRVMSEIAAAPGRYADPVQAQADQLKAHQGFCTADQVASGLCNAVGAMPGADLTVATLFQPAMEGETLYNAKVAFINNAVGLPDGPVPTYAANSGTAAAYELAKSKKDAMVSPAMTALKAIQLDYSGVNAAHGGTDLPLATYYDNEVKRYAGNSPENATWARVMSAQNERGALVELLKIKALDLSIQGRQYGQYEQMEAMLAALTATEINTSGSVNQTNTASERATRQQVMRAVQ